MNPFVDHVRLLTEKDHKTLSQQAMKLAEEVGEVNAAVLQFEGAHGTSYKPAVTKEDIAEECIDVIIVATSILAGLDVKNFTMRKIVTKKLAKWQWALNQ